MNKYLNQLKIFLSKSPEVEGFPYKEVFDNKCHLVLLNCLNREINQNNEAIIGETIWCFSNICLAPIKYLRILIEESKFLEILYSYLDLQKENRNKYIIWTLCNILGESPELKSYILKAGFIDFIIQNKYLLVQDERLENTILWFVCNFIQNEDQIDIQVQYDLLNNFKEYLFLRKKEECFPEIIWAVCFFLNKHKLLKQELILFVHNLNIYDVMLQELKLDNENLFRPILRIICKLSLGGNAITNKFKNLQFKALLFKILSKEVPYYNIDILMIITNLILSDEEFAEFFYDSYFINYLKKLLFDDKVETQIKSDVILVFHSFFTKLSIRHKEKLLYEDQIYDSVLYSLHYLKLSIITNGLNLLEKIFEFAEKVYNSK